MLPQNDGNADDTTTDGAGATRWGWTYPTWAGAMVWTGQTATLAAFGAMTEAQAGVLAKAYIWNRYGGPQLLSGADVSVIDWVWNTGSLAVEIIQQNVGTTPDRIIGPQTLAAIDRMGAGPFVTNCLQWRVSFLNDCGFQTEFPGLYTRAAGVEALALSLIGAS